MTITSNIDHTATSQDPGMIKWSYLKVFKKDLRTSYTFLSTDPSYCFPPLSPVSPGTFLWPHHNGQGARLVPISRIGRHHGMSVRAKNIVLISFSPTEITCENVLVYIDKTIFCAWSWLICELSMIRVCVECCCQDREEALVITRHCPPITHLRSLSTHFHI